MSAMKIRAAAIRELEDRHGRVTPENLVAAARNPRHPLHSDFEWDDKKAAHQHRVSTARGIINSVRTVQTIDHKTVSAVGYIRDPRLPADKPGYVSTVSLRTERDAAMEAITRELSNVQSAIERAREVAAVLDLSEELDAMLVSVTELRSRVRRGPGVMQESAAVS